jgi:hypothetical protein
MQDEELGALRAAGHRPIETCSRCGRSFPIADMVVVEGDALESNMNLEPLCPDCQRELADGEIDLPLTP